MPYVAKVIKCPFYHRSDSNRIVCEGLKKGNTINLVYESTTEKKDYMNRHCKSIDGYCRCRVFKMLEQKYE